MDNSSGEDTDISESEIEEYQDKTYKELKNGNHHIKVSALTVQRKESDITCSSQKRTAKDKSNHLALFKYLEKDLEVVTGPSQPLDVGNCLEDSDCDEMFVWP